LSKDWNANNGISRIHLNQMRLYTFILALFILFSCSDEKKIPAPDIYEVREIGILSTTEYTIGKVIKLDDKSNKWYKYGDRKILIRCKATVKAGIDLRKLNQDDIKIKNDKIEIHLPPVEIVSFEMDPKYVRTAVENITGFRDRFSNAEKIEILKQGEEAIKKEIENTSIYDNAQQNATLFLTDFYKQMGYKDVIIKYEIREDKK
jgi:hypothetical protein